MGVMLFTIKQMRQWKPRAIKVPAQHGTRAKCWCRDLTQSPYYYYLPSKSPLVAHSVVLPTLVLILQNLPFSVLLGSYNPTNHQNKNCGLIPCLYYLLFSKQQKLNGNEDPQILKTTSQIQWEIIFSHTWHTLWANPKWSHFGVRLYSSVLGQMRVHTASFLLDADISICTCSKWNSRLSPILPTNPFRPGNGLSIKDTQRPSLPGLQTQELSSTPLFLSLPHPIQPRLLSSPLQIWSLLPDLTT